LSPVHTADTLVVKALTDSGCRRSVCAWVL